GKPETAGQQAGPPAATVRPPTVPGVPSAAGVGPAVPQYERSLRAAAVGVSTVRCERCDIQPARVGTSMLGPKHLIADDAAWRHAAATALHTVNLSALQLRIDRICAEARALQRTGPIAYAWSGGKDGQVLRWLMEQAGVTECVLGLTADMEFPAVRRW